MKVGIVVEKPDPYELGAIERSVNDSATRVSTIWISYLIFALYLLIVTGTATHKQLFLDEPLKMPVLNIDVPLYWFFVLAPLLLVLLHIYVLVQVLLLGRTAAAYNLVLDRTVKPPPANALLRQRLANTLFAQIFAGSPREKKGWLGYLLKAIAWTTLAVMPIYVLLTFEFVFLPYHSHFATWLHRALILTELIVALLLWPLVLNPDREISWKKISRRATTAVLDVLRLFSTKSQRKYAIARLRLHLVPVAACLLYILVVLCFVTFPGEPHLNLLTGRSLATTNCFRSIFHAPDRLEVPGADVLKYENNQNNERVEESWDSAPRTKSFGGRDLSCGQFGFGNLRHAGFAGTNLSGAQFRQADLQGADFRGATLVGANLSGARLQDADFVYARLDGANLLGARLQGANFVRIKGSDGIGTVSLRAARLNDAHMEGADLTWAKLDGADIHGTHLEGAKLDGASFVGASFSGGFARGAQLGGANLNRANLVGADLEGTNLLAVNLHGADLRGADLRGAVLDGALISNAQLWRTVSSSCANTRVIDSNFDNTFSSLSYDPNHRKLSADEYRAEVESLLDDIVKEAGHDPRPDDDVAATSYRRTLYDGLKRVVLYDNMMHVELTDRSLESEARWRKCEDGASKISERDYIEHLSNSLVAFACNATENKKFVAMGIIHGRMARVGVVDKWISEPLIGLYNSKLSNGLLNQNECEVTKDLNDQTKSFLRAVSSAPAIEGSVH